VGGCTLQCLCLTTFWELKPYILAMGHLSLSSRSILLLGLLLGMNTSARHFCRASGSAWAPSLPATTAIWSGNTTRRCPITSLRQDRDFRSSLGAPNLSFPAFSPLHRAGLGSHHLQQPPHYRLTWMPRPPPCLGRATAVAVSPAQTCRCSAAGQWRRILLRISPRAHGIAHYEPTVPAMGNPAVLARTSGHAVGD